MPIIILTLLLSQPLTDNPVAEAARAIGTRGFANSADTKTTRFKNDGTRRVIATFVNKVSDDEAQRKLIGDFALGLIQDYEKMTKEIGGDSDVAGALAFAVSMLYAAAKGVDSDQEAFRALINRFRASLDLRSASDVQKQEFFEWSLCLVGLVHAKLVTADSEPDMAAIRRLANTQLQNLIGAGIDRLSLKGEEVTLKPEDKK